MIYEYPKEFIVPVVYVKDLKDKSIYRYKKLKSLQEGKLSISNKKLQRDGIILADIDIYGNFKYEDINLLNMEGEVLQEPHSEDILKESEIEDSSKYENAKNIINDIDEDYANSETLGIYNSVH